MTNMALFAEQQVRADLARLLLAAVEASGRARCDIARDAQIHKDALRRVLAGCSSSAAAITRLRGCNRTSRNSSRTFPANCLQRSSVSWATRFTM